MRPTPLLMLLALAFSGCGDDAPTNVPGTIPSNLTFTVVRNENALIGGLISGTQQTTDTIDIGQPPPDRLAGGTAIWRARTLFGDAIDHPGASIEFEYRAVTTRLWDPWRSGFGKEACLVVLSDGRMAVDWVDIDDPKPLTVSDGPAEVRLLLDASGFAAHKRLAVIRVEVYRRGEHHNTLTEDDLLGGFRDRDDRFESRRVWLLSAFANSTHADPQRLTARDGTTVPIEAPRNAPRGALPVVELVDEVLVYRWGVPATQQLTDILLRDITKVEFMDRD